MEPQVNDDYEWEELDYNSLIRDYLPRFETRLEILVTEEVIEPATEELFKYDFERIRTYLDHQRRAIERRKRRVDELQEELFNATSSNTGESEAGTSIDCSERDGT